ncbi:unnamed protein product, partial [Discosporangium mesarthrocarpum]
GVASTITDQEATEFADDEQDDFELDLDKPWTKPNLDEALTCRKKQIWNQGMRHYFGTTVKEMGALGVGIYLYFWVTRVCAMAFIFLGLLSVPAMVLNSQGNGGVSLPETDIDALGLVTLSYGNQGISPDMIISSDCIANNGTIDCTGETVQVFGQAIQVWKVGAVIGGMEAVIAISFAIFISILKGRLQQKIEEIDDDNVTPADYTVMVRGLPPDVTEDEVRDHFHQRYNLTEPRPCFPFLGFGVHGVGVFSGVGLGLFFGVLASPSIAASLGTGPTAALAAVMFMVVWGLIVYGIVVWKKIGQPYPRDTPRQAWEKRRSHARKSKTSKYVVPIETPKEEGGPNDSAVMAEEGRGLSQSTAPDDRLDILVVKLCCIEGPSTIFLTSSLNITHVGKCYTCCKKPPPKKKQFGQVPAPDPQPCQSYLHSRDKSYLGSWVSRVELGHPVGEVLRSVMEKEEIIAKTAKARAKVQQTRTLGQEGKRKKAESRLEKLQEKVEKLRVEANAKVNPEIVESISVAFVTFENEESQQRCLDDYRYSRSSLCRYRQIITGQQEYFQPDELLFKHRGGTKHRLKVLPAPEPSDVKWENLDIPPMEKRLRSAVTWLVCLILLIVSFVIIYMSQKQQAIIQEQIPNLTLCEETLPATFFGTYAIPPRTALQRNVTLDAYCKENLGPQYYALLFSNGSDSVLQHSDLPPLYSPDGTNSSREDFPGTLCDNICHPASGGSTCDALSCGKDGWEDEGYMCETYIASTIVGCFCFEELIAAIAGLGFLAGTREVVEAQGEICTPFITDYIKANAIKILAVVAVVVVNSALTAIMGRLAKFERHVSLSDYTSTITVKLALAQFLNTALIVLIINAGYTGGGLGFLQDMGLLNGHYVDFEKGWYATVGVAVSVTMLVNVVVPHASPLIMEVVVRPLLRLFKRRSAATQAQLNNLYRPPDFSMETRYAFLIQVVFVGMLYSGGIPVMYLLAALSFITNFLVDKLWIIKLAHQPPMYTEALAKMFVGALPMALVLHVAVASYMLGNPSLLNIGFIRQEAQIFAEAVKGQGITGLVADRVLRQQVFPLFFVGLVYIVLGVTYNIVGDKIFYLFKVMC